MLNFYVPLLLLLMVAVLFIHQASALHMESLNSHYKSPPKTFAYQVGIIGKKNHSNALKLVCGGGIIAPDIVLTAAECFINENGTHREFTFYVFSDVTNLNILTGFSILIELIYLVQEGPVRYHNLAVVKLAEEFDFLRYPHLRILDIPETYEYFWEETGSVAGHGYYYYRTWINESGQREFINAGTDLRLRNATVRVLISTTCSMQHRHFNFSLQFCGFMNPLRRTDVAGICKYDTGSPLVIENKAVGVAGSPNRNCDDSRHGSLYARVSSYIHFILGILEENPLTGTIAYKNRMHIPSTHQTLLYDIWNYN